MLRGGPETMFGPKKSNEPSGPFWKRLMRAALISAGTALIVKLVDALLFPEDAARGKESE